MLDSYVFPKTILDWNFGFFFVSTGPGRITLLITELAFTHSHLGHAHSVPSRTFSFLVFAMLGAIPAFQHDGLVVHLKQAQPRSHQIASHFCLTTSIRHPRGWPRQPSTVGSEP